MKKVILPPLFLAVMLLVSFKSYCQEERQISENIQIGNKLTFKSKILDEEREIWVKLPAGYSDSSSDYPVVYLLDAATHFTYTAGLLDQLGFRSVPESILIGIKNTNRNRDLTPPKSNVKSDDPNSNKTGADNFLKMLEEELIPFVDQKFRTSKFKTLIGHSYGGLFIVHLLTKKPELFNAYIAISPSLWWDDQKLVEKFETYLTENPDMKGCLYLTMANENGVMLGGLMKIVGILETQSPKNLRWKYDVYPDENHMSVPVISQIEGFQFIYEDWYVSDPYKEYQKYGLDALKLRSVRIKNEFDTDWQLDNQTYAEFLFALNENGHFKDQLELSLDLINKGNKEIEFYEAIARSYLALNDKENAIKYYTEVFNLNPDYNDVSKILDSLKADKKNHIRSEKSSKND